MYNVSQNFKDRVYLDSTRHLLNVYIDGQKIDGKYILGFSRDFDLFDDKFGFGGTPSAQIELKIHKNGLPNTYQEIYVETGIDNEIIPLGTYRLEEINKDDNYTVTIKAMDYMLKFEFNYDGSTLFSENKKSATLMEVLQDICSKAEVELGSTSFLNQDKSVAVYDNTVTARTYLSYIAEQAGGFAFIGRDNKLYIKTIASSIVEKVPFRLFQKYTWGEEFRVSRIAYEDGIQDFKAGNEIDLSVADIHNYTVRQVNELLVKYMYKNCNTVWINSDNMYIVDKEQIENIYNLYQLFSCWSFEGTTIINPALDLGDMIEIDGRKVIYQGKIEYKGKFKADISSKIQAKSKEDSMVTRVSNATKIRRVQALIDQINGLIQLLATEVDDNTSKMSEFLLTMDGIKETVTNNTNSIKNIKSDAVSEAIKATEDRLDVVLEDYVTTAEVGTIVTTKAGEIETNLTAKLNSDLKSYAKTSDLNDMFKNYSTTTEMQNYVKETTNSFERTISEKITTQINGIDIATDNLVYNSVGMLGMESWSTPSVAKATTQYSASYPSVSKRTLRLATSSTTEGTIASPRFEVNSGGTYTISGWIMTDSNCKGMKVQVKSSTSKNAEDLYHFTNDTSDYVFLAVDATNKSWTYFTKTFTLPANSKSALVLFSTLGSNKNGTTCYAYLSDLMIVKGNKAMTWNVSSKDAQAQITENTSSITQTAKEIALKVGKGEIISSINQSAETVSIGANKIKWEGAVTANNYFKINLDGSMEASSGTIAGINFDWSGLHYYGSDSHDGFGLYKSGQGWLTTDTPLGASSQIIFMAGGNGGHIGDAKFRLYQNGEMFAEKGKIGPFKVTANTLESDSVGISANEYYAFWTKISGTTTSFITWNGDISCKSIIVNGYPLVRTLGNLNCVNTFYRDGNQLVATMPDIMFVVLPDSITSDKKLKTNIENTKINAIEFYKKLTFRQFNMQKSGEFEKLGLVAQELEKIDKDFVSEVVAPDTGEKTKLINQAKFIMHNAKAIQELIDRLEKVEEKLGV